MCDYAFTVCAGAFGVDNALGDTLSCEVGEFVDEVEVGHYDRALWTGSH